MSKSWQKLLDSEICSRQLPRLLKTVAACAAVAAAHQNQPSPHTSFSHLEESSDVEWWPLRYDIASISTGRQDSTAICRPCRTALYTALASPPSTRTDGMPYMGPLEAMPSPAQAAGQQGAAVHWVRLRAVPGQQGGGSGTYTGDGWWESACGRNRVWGCV